MGRPRRASNWGTIRAEQRDGAWHLDGRFRDSAGKDQRYRASGPTREIAEQRLRDKTPASGDNITDRSPFSMLAEHWLRRRQEDVDLWAEGYAAGEVAPEALSPQSHARYSSAVNTIILPELGSVPIGDVTTRMLNELIRKLGRASASRASTAQTLVNQMLIEACDLGVITHNPMSTTRRRRSARRTVVAYDATQLATIRAAWDRWVSRKEERKGGVKPDAGAIAILLVSVGSSLRINEVLALRPTDVDLTGSRHTLSVTGTLVSGKGIPLHRQDHPKEAGQERAIVIGSEVSAILQRQVGLAAGPEAPLWPSRTGGWRSAANLRRIIRAFRSDMADELRGGGVDPEQLKPHAMRRTATTAVARKLSVQAAKDLAGHANTATTEAHYVQPYSVIDGGQAAVLDELLGGA